jgi:hypothetical protein
MNHLATAAAIAGQPPVARILWDDPRLYSLVSRNFVLLSAPSRVRALADARLFVEFVLGLAV